jgi:hypothetical protein
LCGVAERAGRKQATVVAVVAAGGDGDGDGEGEGEGAGVYRIRLEGEGGAEGAELQASGRQLSHRQSTVDSPFHFPLCTCVACVWYAREAAQEREEEGKAAEEHDAAALAFELPKEAQAREAKAAKAAKAAEEAKPAAAGDGGAGAGAGAGAAGGGGGPPAAAAAAAAPAAEAAGEGAQ